MPKGGAKRRALAEEEEPQRASAPSGSAGQIPSPKPKQRGEGGRRAGIAKRALEDVEPVEDPPDSKRGGAKSRAVEEHLEESGPAQTAGKTTGKTST